MSAASFENVSAVHRGRVYAVDDLRSTRVWLNHTLRDHFDVAVFATGQELLDAAREHCPDVILSDSQMEPMDGPALCRLVKAEARLRTVPFLMFSAGDAQDRIRTLDDGADDYLVKTVTPGELVARVRSMVRLRFAYLALEAANVQLEAAMKQRTAMEAELRLAQKLEAVGQLAAGISHEINTPMQYVGDSVIFLQRAFQTFAEVLSAQEQSPVIARLLQRVPRAFERTLEGVERVTTIVRAMKDLAHPDESEQAPADLNKAIQDALVVTRNEYKYVADVETDLAELPPVVCHLGGLNQVLLNLIVNAAHAISDVVGGSDRRGSIRVKSEQRDGWVVIRLSDTGPGIPEAIRSRIFDPFFTTKPVGKGTGQGLSIARSIVVDKHGGKLSFETELGRGTTFIIELPVEGRGER